MNDPEGLHPGTSVESRRGPRYIGGAEVRLGAEGQLPATLFTVTEQPIQPDDLVNRAEEGAEERRLTPAETEILNRYSQETWQNLELNGNHLTFPMSPIGGADRYLDEPDRVDSMRVSVLPGRFQIHPELAEYQAQLIAAHPNITNGSMVSVAGFDSRANHLTIRECGYHDVFALATSGADRPLGHRDFDGRNGDTVRDLASSDRLPELAEDSLVPNSFGVGGLLFTGDGQMLLARRRSGLGVASAAGTFGYAAAGNLNYSPELLRALDSRPAHQALGERGIGQEASEELGLKSRFVNLGRLTGDYMHDLAHRELGLEPDELSISPAGFVRDGLHTGLVQATYVLTTPLPAEQVVERMVTSPDAKKEYDMVLAIPATAQNAGNIMLNTAMANGVNINTETRSSLALVTAQRRGAELLRG